MDNLQKGSAKVWVIMVIVVAAALGYFLWSQNSPMLVRPPVTVTNTTPPPTNTTSNPPVAVTTTVTPPEKKSKYKDGTYTAAGNYESPGGSELIQVSVTLKNDVITDATVVANMPSGGTARRFQSMFVQNFKQYVIGKNIDQVATLGRVAGSSLTPMGWDDAIAQIQDAARA